jgi:hypothetical protein
MIHIDNFLLRRHRYNESCVVFECKDIPIIYYIFSDDKDGLTNIDKTLIDGVDEI